MTKRLILAALSGSIVQFLLGWLIYGLLLANFMSTQMTHFEGLMKDMNTWTFMLLTFFSGLAMSFLIAFIFQRWAKFDRFVKGMTAGMIFGGLVTLSFDLYSLGAMNMMTVAAAVVDVITSIITTGIVGGVIACVLGYKLEKKAEQPAA